MVRPILPRLGSGVFKPGDEVPRSGIYRAIHAKEHTKTHEVTCDYSDRFPPCGSCGEDVRFVLVLGAQHITSHENFKSRQALTR